MRGTVTYRSSTGKEITNLDIGFPRSADIRKYIRKKCQPSGKLGKARKATKSARAKATKRTVARAKPKPAPVKKAVRKVKRPAAPAVETVAVEVIEQPAPGVITVTEVEETRQVS